MESIKSSAGSTSHTFSLQFSGCTAIGQVKPSHKHQHSHQAEQLTQPKPPPVRYNSKIDRRPSAAGLADLVAELEFMHPADGTGRRRFTRVRPCARVCRPWCAATSAFILLSLV